MLKYIGKRLLMMIPVILGISFIIFAIMDLTPGDPARMVLGEGATPEAVEQKREEMGLNEPFIVRYANFVCGVLRGEFPDSYVTNEPVSKEVVSRFPTTLKLALLGTALSAIVGVSVGIISAVKQYSIIDSVSMITAMLLTSIPAFWMGLMLILLFSVKPGLASGNRYRYMETLYIAINIGSYKYHGITYQAYKVQHAGSYTGRLHKNCQSKGCHRETHSIQTRIA